MDEAIAKALEEWGKAQIFKETEWKGASDSAYLVDVLKNRPEVEDELVTLLTHPNQLVVAYSLLTLSLMRSSKLGNLPSELLDRKEKISRHSGSFREKMELGAYAKQVQKIWLKNRSQKN